MSFLINYVICLIRISKKLKYLKNEAGILSGILSVLSNKTNVILGFSSTVIKIFLYVKFPYINTKYFIVQRFEANLLFV